LERFLALDVVDVNINVLSIQIEIFKWKEILFQIFRTFLARRRLNLSPTTAPTLKYKITMIYSLL